MSIGRFSVTLSAIVFGGFGVAFLFFPLFMASIVSIELPTPSAVIDFRATYGGLEIGLAGFFTICALRDSWLRLGLVAQTVSLGGFAFGRIIGLILDGTPQPIIYYLLVAECAGCVLGLYALVKERHIND
ncbi:MAG: DUF4345 domain-containing protein [Acidobacteriota bacterium]|nr:DUF4345 domain-containing protein [Acidobacteriota bacterium]